jgi:hypothetical protein
LLIALATGAGIPADCYMMGRHQDAFPLRLDTKTKDVPFDSSDDLLVAFFVKSFQFHSGAANKTAAK